jgi:hypothetical protein
VKSKREYYIPIPALHFYYYILLHSFNDSTADIMIQILIIVEINIFTKFIPLFSLSKNTKKKERRTKFPAVGFALVATGVGTGIFRCHWPEGH